MSLTPIPRPAWPPVQVQVDGEWLRVEGGPPAVARLLGVNRATVWRWFRSGNLPEDKVRLMDNPMDNGGAE